MTEVVELLEEVRTRWNDADFIEIRVEDGQMRVYRYDEDTFELILAKEYKHFSDIMSPVPIDLPWEEDGG